MQAPHAPALSGDIQAGIGWRHPHYPQLLQQQPSLDFLEVHSENFFASGGAALAVLVRGRALYPICLHGVGLSLGSVAGEPPAALAALAALAAAASLRLAGTEAGPFPATRSG